ncbi:MAG TPA: hypothetical protein VJB57_11550 [Dehalococcoidia bacterium]|nr:hypothetical protein [Dehalococcoidia bacterium]
MALKLTVTCGPNPRLEPLIDGTVKPEGIELEFNVQNVEVMFYKNLHEDDFEVSEMSLSETLLARDRREKWGKGKWNWSGIPIFLSRGHAWVRAMYHSGRTSGDMADLRGKHIAVPDYDMTAALWWRATLKDMYGIEASDVRWSNMRTRGLSHGIELGLNEDSPPGVTLTWMPEAGDRPEMMDRGDFDACFGVYQPPFAPAGRKPAPEVKPYFTDEGKKAVTDYFRKTQCFQPNHHYVIQDRIAQANPWVPMALYQAFEESKQVAYERAGRKSNAYLYFDGDPAEQASIYGDDPYPFGLKAMRRTLERLEQASFEQGLIRNHIQIDALYHPSTLQT